MNTSLIPAKSTNAVDRTVLINHAPYESSPSLTANDNAPHFEHLQERMVYATRVKSEEQSVVGINPLIDAASSLLILPSELKREMHLDIELLQSRLVGEIKAFEFQATNLGIDNSQLAISRYVLCTFIDETVVTTPWGNDSGWSQHSMLSTFHNETYGGEKFFLLLERLTRNPAKYLHLLELMYLCLSLGFEGKYRVLARGLTELEAIRDSLYRQIRMLRGDNPSTLSPNWEPKSLQRHKLTRRTSLLGIGCLVILSLAALYSGFYYVLDQQSALVIDNYVQISEQGS